LVIFRILLIIFGGLFIGSIIFLYVRSIMTPTPNYVKVEKAAEQVNVLSTLQKTHNVDIILALKEYVRLMRLLPDVIPTSVLNRLIDIGESSIDLNKKIKTGIAFDDRKTLMYFTIISYVPSILRSYLKLSKEHRIEDTEATHIVSEQLDTIIVALSQFNSDEDSRVINAMKIHASFVRDKFKEL
jgi:hypothetical protein